MDGSKFDDLARALGRGASRRKLLRGLAGGLAGLLGGGALAKLSADAAGRELVICHATGNPDTPFESMTIDQAEYNLHARHGDYLRVECCADRDCPNTAGDCGDAVCQNGYCTQLPAAAGTPCGEGLVCTKNAVCDGSFNCVGTPVVCEQPEHPCFESVCSESTGGCRVVFKSGVLCDESNACADYICADGGCKSIYKPACTGNCFACGDECVDLNSNLDHCGRCNISCNDGNECRVSICRGYCDVVPVNEGGACTTDSGDPSTCANGACQQECPTGASCSFVGPRDPNAIGICADGACTCKPSFVPGMCTCDDDSSITGCCSLSCDCETGACR